MKYKCPVCKHEFEEAEWEKQTAKYQAPISSIYGTGAPATAACPKCTSFSSVKAIIKETTEKNK